MRMVAYLESLPSREVEAVFEVTLDFGRTRGFRLVRVGDHELPAGFGT